MSEFERMFKETAHNYTPERYNKMGYRFMEKWYDRYLEFAFPFNSHIHKQIYIPRKIHQVWVGGKPIPEEYAKYMESWKAFHPTWEYRLWTDEDTEQIPSLNQDIYRKMTNAGAKSDYIRYALLYDFGGIYVDADFECLKPHDDLRWLNLFSSVADDKNPVIYIGHMGCEKGHPVMAECLENIRHFNDSSNKQIMETTGVYYFTKNFFRVIPQQYAGAVVFPPEYFYPFPGNQRKITSRFHRFSFCTQNTYAIHHWGTSWTRK